MTAIVPSEPARAPAPDPTVVRFRQPLWRYLRALGASLDEAEDLVQEVLLVACRAPLPAAEGAAKAFLRGVAKNQWLRTRRWWHRHREREVAAAVDELWIATADGDDGDVLVETLRTCLAALQERARTALELHYRDGLDWRSVAGRVGLKPNGTKTLVQRARAALRECIERSKP